MFFQTVSNSSWVNYGYLVTLELQGSDTKKELEILASLHGVEFIELDVHDPLKSQVIIPAREKMNVDCATANRLCDENTDFKRFIDGVIYFYKTSRINEADFDIPH